MNNLACSLSLNLFVPSLLRSVDENMFRHTILLELLKSYIGNKNSLKNQFLSPVIADEEYLKKFPRVRMICSGIDPMRDTAYVFAYRLA